MKKLCFDLDGVICNTTKNYYKKSTPKKKVIEAINKLYKSNHITIFTSRYMGRSKENIRLAKKRGYVLTLNQLHMWGLNFHKLQFGKPSYDIFVDDKNLDFKKDWLKRFKKKYYK